MFALEFTHIQAALGGAVPDLILATWQELAGEHVHTGFYNSFLSFSRMYPYGGDPLSCAVANTAPYAKALEDGRAGFHLPSAIDWGAAQGRGTAKVSKAGRRYLRVPFRHYTPGGAAGGLSSGRGRAMMPASVHRDALTALRGDRTRREARDAAARLAEAGPRLSRPYSLPGFPAALRARALQVEGMPGYTWRSPLYAGMRRREQVNPVTGNTSGVFQTLRTLTEDSVGWYIPPFGGFHFAARTVERVRPMIEEILGEAAREDLVELIQVQVGH
jgi:hypothetical protein